MPFRTFPRQKFLPKVLFPIFSFFIVGYLENEGNKLGMKGLASLLEYTYLDVKNLNDRDNGINIFFVMGGYFL